MLRAIRMTAVGGLALATAVVALAQEESRWQLYDLRDLAAVLAVPPPIAAPPDPAHAAAGAIEAAAPPAVSDGPEPLDSVLNELTNVMGLNASAVLEGVYVIEADAQQHAQLADMLQRVRALYAQSYELEIALFEVNSSDAPQLGEVVTDDSPVMRQRIVLAGRTRVPLTWVTQHQYVSDLQAVVAENAVAFEPRTASAEGGLRLQVSIDGDNDSAESGSVTLRLTGEYRRVALERKSGSFASSSGGNVWLDLPQMSICAISSHVRLTPAKRTAVCIVDDVEGGATLVLAAWVRRLAE